MYQLNSGYKPNVKKNNNTMLVMNSHSLKNAVEKTKEWKDILKKGKKDQS